MTLKRIHSIPPPGIPHHAIPLYGLPTADIEFSPRTLNIFRGGITLAQDDVVEAENDIDLRNEIEKDDRLGFRFKVENPASNPTAYITEFGVTNAITLFKAFNSSDDPTGDFISAGDTFDLVFFTTFGLSELQSGVNDLSGTWTLGNTFAGFNDVMEEYSIRINYRVIVRFLIDSTKKVKLGSGKLRADVFVDEYSILNKRERQSFEGGNSISPG